MSDIKASTLPTKSTVKFTKSNTTTTWLAADDLSILELAEKAGLKPVFGCRSGMCGSCEVVVSKGKLHGPEGWEDKTVRICQGFPATTEVEIEL